MLLTQHETGLRDNLALLETVQQELVGDILIIEEYAAGNISYWQALGVLEDHVVQRVSNTQRDTRSMLILASVIIGLDLGVCSITAFLLMYKASRGQEMRLKLSGRELLLKRLSHDVKGTLINLRQSLEEVGLHHRLKANVEHIIHCIEAIVCQAGDAGTTDTGQSFTVCEFMDSLHQLYPGIKLEVCNPCMVVCIPCLLYVSIYQILRNSFVHGGAVAECSICHWQQGEWCVITVFNSPGMNHDLFLAEVDAESRLKLALSGRVAKVPSSTMGLADVIEMCGKQPNASFEIDWSPDGVSAAIRVPVVHAVAPSPQQSGVTLPPAAEIRLCVIDDQIGPRIAALQLTRLVHPEYNFPPEGQTTEACWEDHLVKVGGATTASLQQCIDWVNTAPLSTIVLLDRMLEYPDAVIDGLDLIPALTAHGAVVLVRSGNCSEYDRETYKDSGAFGCVSKALYGSGAKAELQRAQRHLLGWPSNKKEHSKIQ